MAVDFDAVVEVARAIPGVSATASARGRALKIGGKLLACDAIHKSAEPNSLMVRIGQDQRDVLLAAKPDTYYLTDHYRGYAAVLVRLAKIGRKELRDLLRSAAEFVTASRSGAGRR